MAAIFYTILHVKGSDFLPRDALQRIVTLSVFLKKLLLHSIIIIIYFREPARWEDEKRPESYLIPEFKERLSEAPIEYKLQIQLHEVSPDDSHLILHPSRVWDQENHPWLDLALVTMTSLLSVAVVERTRCSLDNHPSTISIPPAQTIYDYNSISYLRSKVYSSSNKMSSNKPRSAVCKQDACEGARYSVRVRTGNRKGAGTDAKVSLTITGEITYKTYFESRM